MLPPHVEFAKYQKTKTHLDIFPTFIFIVKLKYSLPKKADLLFYNSLWLGLNIITEIL